MRVKFTTAACLLVLAFATACHRQPPATAYSVEGTVARTYPGESRIQIAHDRIPGYMEAMTMEFTVKEPATVAGLEPGDRIRFDLIVTRDQGWIENVRRVGKATTKPSPNLANYMWAPPLKIGEVVPAAAFTNELGHAVKLSDYRGQALAITFIFTRCPFPDYCPRMSRQMAKVSESLAYIPNAPTNWHLFSVSFDPEYDQPSILRDYRNNLHVEDGRWNFLTGPPEDIKRFCAAFGVYFVRDRGSVDHNLVTAVIDMQGRLQRLFPGNKWKPDDLIDELAGAAAPTVPPPKALVTR